VRSLTNSIIDHQIKNGDTRINFGNRIFLVTGYLRI
jgi:hypothetical protein